MSDIENIAFRDDDNDDDWLDDTAGVDEFDIEIDEKVAELLNTKVDNAVTEITIEDNCTESDESTPKKKKRVKKIVDPFVKLTKKYFSSLNSRTAKYAIFNLNMFYTNKLVMVSSKNKSTFDDYMYQYMPGDLSIQIVEFKNDDLEQIKEKLKIPDTCTLINLSALRKYINVALKHASVEILPLNIARTDDNNLYLKVVDPSDETISYIERFGFAFTNWRVVVLLTGLVDSMTDFNHEHAVTENVTYSDLEAYMYQNLIVYQVLTSKYTDSDGKPIFDYLVDTHKTKLYMIDGKDIICVKECVKKLKPDYEFTLTIQSYVSLPDKCIFYKTKYEDADNVIISSRPYVSVFPICTSAKEFKQYGK